MASAALGPTTSARRLVVRFLPYALVANGSLAGVLITAQPQSLRIVAVGWAERASGRLGSPAAAQPVPVATDKRETR
jgi:hypothetical protein